MAKAKKVLAAVGEPDVMPAPAPAPIQDEPALPWLDATGRVLKVGDLVKVLPDVSKRLSGKLANVVGNYDSSSKSIEIEVLDDEPGLSNTRILPGYLVFELKAHLNAATEASAPVTAPDEEVRLSMEAWDLLSKIILLDRVPATNLVGAEVQLQELQHAGLIEDIGAAYRATAAGITADGVEVEVRRTPLDEAAEAHKAGLRMVPLASIVVTTNTRKVFDETALAELAESVRAHGILQPIVLRPHGTESGKYELVAGGRRYRAAQLAELVEVPATVRNLTDREFLEVQLLENLQRVDVRPADEAQAFSKLLASHLSPEEIAQRVGKPVKFVLQRAKLVALIPFWFELLESEKLALVAAHELARLPAHSQLAVKHEVEKHPSYYEKGYSKTDIRNIINDKVLRKLDKAPWDKADALLVRSAGPCTLCPKRSAAQGVLFEMKDGVDLCLDASCFNGKRAAFVSRRLAELTAELGKAPLQASSNYSLDGTQKDAGIIASRDWYQSHEGATGAVQVLMVDGADAGQIKHVRLTGLAAMKEGNATATAAQKAEDAARIRKERTKKMHRTLLAEALTIDLPLHLNNDGPAAHATLAHFLLEELSGRAGQKLEYMKTYWGWEPTEEESETGWNHRDEQGRTPWARYILKKVSELTLSQKQYLYFTLKVRHRMDHEYEDLQFSIANIAGTYEHVATEAEQATEERYYTRKGKKQEATA
jgi:ParB/RepB/Spo0J family partition protein